MTMLASLRCGTLLLSTLVISPFAASAAMGADPAPLATAYGNGVHAFNGGDYQRSLEDLGSVIEAGTRDPRAYYFRGLAALKLGREDEAVADFEQGANLEADFGGGHTVARALERVQGSDRLKLERYRARARVAALQRNREANRQRYSDIQDSEVDVLRRRRPAPAMQAQPAEPLQPPAPKPEAPEPMAEEQEEPAVRRPGSMPAEADDPFGDEPATPKPAPAADDTF
jgi:tetratricopeptide (TPR) repeat protein